MIAEPLIASCDGKDQGQYKIDQPQPGKEAIKEPKSKIQNAPDPQIVIPMFFLNGPHDAPPPHTR